MGHYEESVSTSLYRIAEYLERISSSLEVITKDIEKKNEIVNNTLMKKGM